MNANSSQHNVFFIHQFLKGSHVSSYSLDFEDFVMQIVFYNSKGTSRSSFKKYNFQFKDDLLGIEKNLLE